MRSAKKTNKVKRSLANALGIFLDWLYVTMLIVSVLGILMLGAIAVASSLNTLRMTGYLDILFGIQAIIAIYTLVWLPAAALVYYYKQE
tara:strand:+ start:821 stop:1087 length:267 start_codon:yes stop_codon:yes gene_type:complete